ncbi:MAG: tRNA (adenosine(37)-N6)-threonylcarbamoyltransferase complex dimerization subunit type 1 TsaB [Pseudomonadota bacterium]
MLLLAIDTSAHLSAVSLYDCENGITLQDDIQNIGRGHAEIVMKQVENCLEMAGRSYRDIGKIGVVKGPGSFTGVRVGLSVARGLALSLKIDAIGVSGLDALEAAAVETGFDGNITTVIDARRDEAYCKISGKDVPFVKPYKDIAACVPENIATICGSGSKMLEMTSSRKFVILHELASPPIETVARLATDAEPEKHPPEPLYLRSADAKPQSGFTLKRTRDLNK